MAQSRQKHGSKNRNDGNYDQQLDQRKTADGITNRPVVLARLQIKITVPDCFEMIANI